MQNGLYYVKKGLKHQWSASYSVKIIISNGKDAFTIDFLKK